MGPAGQSAAPQTKGAHKAIIVAAFVVLGSIAVSTPWGIALGVLLLAWAIAGALGKIKSPAAWLLSGASSRITISALSLGLGGFVTTCGLLGLSDRGPRPGRAASAEDEAKTIPPGAELAEKTTADPSTATPTASELPFTLFSNDDHESPIKDQKSRVLVIKGKLSEDELRKALLDYYQLMRAELEDSKNSTRHVWIFAYPSESRAKLGGDWHGRASAMAFDGAPLPLEPEITLKLPNKDVPEPTELEDEIHDALIAELETLNSDHAYQVKVLKTQKTLTEKDIEEMSRLSNEDEKQAERNVAKRYKISVEELNDIYIRVLASRQ